MKLLVMMLTSFFMVSHHFAFTMHTGSLFMTESKHVFDMEARSLLGLDACTVADTLFAKSKH